LIINRILSCLFSVGQTAGWFIGNVVFLTLESKDFCNKYVRYYLGLPEQAKGLLTLGCKIFE
jgi:PAT family acetyl-CoA transporter-like MFS transporter 1